MIEYQVHVDAYYGRLDDRTLILSGYFEDPNMTLQQALQLVNDRVVGEQMNRGRELLIRARFPNLETPLFKKELS